MKQAFYRFAYRIASRLSDITGGAALFVKWKVAIAAVIISLSGTAITSCKPTCYDPGPTCYVPAPTCYITPEEPCPEEGGDNEPDDSETTASFPQA